jgi:hypothetical protein
VSVPVDEAGRNQDRGYQQNPDGGEANQQLLHKWSLAAGALSTDRAGRKPLNYGFDGSRSNRFRPFNLCSSGNYFSALANL